ncbi:MAG TPA: hypothetical protein VEA80_16775 [Vitreimonas sp.]|uniref:hypothetical protein n=1 Tax=Vitreimonas sp. TaxID=3069702 RepID=UPI002D62515C|nr:hypothetical protein [Vitreimonas sp.]HYD89134.1 hypothetical protein [Vitreimonas sp.]
MPVVLRHSPELDLNVVEYHGAMTLAELKALAAFQAQNPVHLQRDALTIVLPDADFGAVDLDALDALFARYRAMFAPLAFQFLRRSAWLCFSENARAHVDYWVNGRDTRSSMSSAVRSFDSFAEAADWLVLTKEEAALLESRESFEEVVRYEIPIRLVRAAL